MSFSMYLAMYGECIVSAFHHAREGQSSACLAASIYQCPVKNLKLATTPLRLCKKAMVHMACLLEPYSASLLPRLKVLGPYAHHSRHRRHARERSFPAPYGLSTQEACRPRSAGDFRATLQTPRHVAALRVKVGGGWKAGLGHAKTEDLVPGSTVSESVEPSVWGLAILAEFRVHMCMCCACKRDSPWCRLVTRIKSFQVRTIV